MRPTSRRMTEWPYFPVGRFVKAYQNFCELT